MTESLWTGERETKDNEGVQMRLAKERSGVVVAGTSMASVRGEKASTVAGQLKFATIMGVLVGRANERAATATVPAGHPEKPSQASQPPKALAEPFPTNSLIPSVHREVPEKAASLSCSTDMVLIVH